MVCRSIKHWSTDCPNQSLHKVNIDSWDLINLQKDTIGYNALVVTSEVSKSVCGLTWLLSYLKTLTPHEKSKVVVDSTTSKIFSIMGSGRVSSLHTVTIPFLRDGKKQISIEVEVVDRDIPLLVSRSALSKGRADIDPYTDTMSMSGIKLYLNVSREGHYYMLLTNTPSSSCLDESDSFHNLSSSLATEQHKDCSSFIRDQVGDGRKYVIHLG